MPKRNEISQAELARQREIMRRAAELSAGREELPLAYVDTYGCQQNEADSETIRGMLREMGWGFTDTEEQADLIVINTCAVREHAEMRVFGNVGALVHLKREKPSLRIVVCGCMVQQPHIAEKIKKSFHHVDMVLGPHELWRFPEFMERLMSGQRRIFAVDPGDGFVAEGLPVMRNGSVKAWLSIMNGCNNFCTYCIVPYVRGRERSRESRYVLDEARGLAASGYKDITLLGQNVNSYGKDLGTGEDFSSLIEEINSIDGDFLIRFMTSHPKDATRRLFETMARCEKTARGIHLPFQAGNNRVLAAMNRGYTAEKYMSLIDTARELMPDLVITSDVIVGFPGETDDEFEDTLRLIEKVRFEALFTFIYSPREGTPAAKMADPFTREAKQRRFDALIELQNGISEEKHSRYVGNTLRVLVDGLSAGGEFNLSSRTSGNRLVHLKGNPSLIGSFVNARITASTTWALFGEIV